jgi:DNA modification methylase
MLQQLSEEHDIAPWFDADDLAEILGTVEELPAEGLTDADDVPEAPEEPVTKPGDVWLLGKHRVMCGDSTVITDVERLMAGAKAALMHADPPYGMGKASDGVANDNLYNEDLDSFQMEWWATFRPFLLDNASAYIWGNAPELWRLWYKAGLGESEKLELRNQIVWDKKAIPGMKSPGLTQYPIASEHCLFFQFGNQFLGNVNADDFPETWEPIRSYMEGEARAANINAATIKERCGVQMFSHWFTRSQFTLIPENHYKTLASAYVGRFLRPWRQLKTEWDKVKGGPNSEVQGARSYFDNAHDVMRDVWEFGRVTGEERHGHATPKPVAMMERVMLSSLPKGGLCVEPFGGSGSTLMGAEKTGRACYSMELNPIYCDVIVKRWEDFTGKKAMLEESKEAF